MDIVFMGTPAFAVPILDRILQEGHNILAVVSQPDKPSGRGKKVLFGETKKFAIEKSLNIMQPIKVREPEFILQLKSFNPDIIIVAAYGQILPTEILEMPKYGCINVHGSLLPKYRGAAPIQRCIINGDKTTGITIMKMAEKMDAGDMILKEEIPIESCDNYQTLHDKLADLGAKSIVDALKLIEMGLETYEKQDEELVTYAPMITKQTGNIDWSLSNSDIINLIRGLNPSPGAYTSFKGDKIKIWSAKEMPSESYSLIADFGQVIDVIKEKGIVVKTGEAPLLLLEIQSQGGKRMSCADFLRGRTVLKGDLFERTE